MSFLDINKYNIHKLICEIPTPYVKSNESYELTRMKCQTKIIKRQIVFYSIIPLAVITYLLFTDIGLKLCTVLVESCINHVKKY